jgi:hypothetical protein
VAAAREGWDDMMGVCKMITTVWGVVHEGKVQLPPEMKLEEGSRVLVTALPGNDERNFWLNASQSSLDAVWNNPEDDKYAELLKE